MISGEQQEEELYSACLQLEPRAICSRYSQVGLQVSGWFHFAYPHLRHMHFQIFLAPPTVPYDDGCTSIKMGRFIINQSSMLQ